MYVLHKKENKLERIRTSKIQHEQTIDINSGFTPRDKQHLGTKPGVYKSTNNNQISV